MTLDCSSLRRAVASLDEALAHERQADEVAQQAERFAGDARALLLVLESRHA